MSDNWLKRKLAERRARQAEARRKEEERRAEVRRREQEAEQRKQEQERKELQTKKNILAIIESGRVPDVNFRVSGEKLILPFKFQQSECLIWVFGSVRYLERKTRRKTVGRSAGTSVRVMKGVSVRLGQSVGTPVEYDELVDRGSGVLAITTKHIYFSGDERSIRIPFSKVVSVVQMNDGVEVTRDRVSGQPEFFVVGRDLAWFAHDLMHEIPSAEISAKSEQIVEVENYHLLTHDGIDDMTEEGDNDAE